MYLIGSGIILELMSLYGVDCNAGELTNWYWSRFLPLISSIALNLKTHPREPRNAKSLPSDLNPMDINQ